MSDKENVDQYQEIINDIIPILDEMNRIREFVDEKTYLEITKDLNPPNII